jgi:formamidopyrimidine-DNA glycosylase
MPELPEVETVRRTLSPAVGMEVTGIRVSKKPLRLGKRVVQKKVWAALGNDRIQGLRRFGKYLLLDGARQHSLLVHLGMSGQLGLCPPDAPILPHTHVVLELKGRRGRREIRYVDPRRFGFVDIVEHGHEFEHPALKILGPDPLNTPLAPDYLFAESRGRTSSIKAFLLNQSILAGIGNIYASEALWLAGILPSMPAGRLSKERAARLTGAISQVLDAAVKNRGTTFSNFVDADGQPGENVDYLRVYGRDGEACQRCGKDIRRSVQQGRSTFFCRACQTR